MSNSFSQVMLGDIDHVHLATGADGEQQIVTQFVNGGELRMGIQQAAEYVADLLTLIPNKPVQRILLGADCSGAYTDLGDNE